MDLKKYKRIIAKINKLESYCEGLKEGDFIAKTALLKMGLKRGDTLEKLLPEAFSLVREAARRITGLRAYDVQLMGAIAAHEGHITEMKTGEGKTLAIVFAAYLNALEGKGVHVITTNDYLAHRDWEWTGPIYRFLGISSDSIIGNTGDHERQIAYNANVTYITNNEIGFDFLRDQMIYNKKNRRQRDLNFAIIDEADSVLIDEAQIPLVISDQKPTHEKDRRIFKKLNSIVVALKAGVDFKIDKKEQTVSLTINGIRTLEKTLGIDHLYTDGKIDYVYFVEQLLKAHNLYKKDRDYIIEDGRVVIVDEFTGRLMKEHRYAQSIHQAIEAKEGLSIQDETRVLASITFQHLFKKYKKIAGLTGTAQSAEKEFKLLYEKDIAIIPTNKPIKRVDKKDRFFLDWQSKVKHVAQEASNIFINNGAALIGTRSVEKSNDVHIGLMGAGVPSNVLNAKNNQREAEIIAGAGKAQAVTVATNMAGRGTHIELDDFVKIKGGLQVIGMERHNTRRIDNQLIGRAGRQGELGSSQFLISAEDKLIRTHFRVEYERELKRNKDWKGGVESRRLQKILKKAQVRMENMFFDQRVMSYEFDRVLNEQRESFYRQRRRILNDNDLKKETLGLIKNEVYKIILSHQQKVKSGQASKRRMQLIAIDLQKLVINPWFRVRFKPNKSYRLSVARDLAYKSVVKYYDDFEEYLGSKNVRLLEKTVTLKVLDLAWIDFLKKVESFEETALISSIGNTDFFRDFEVQMASTYRSMLLSMPRLICLTMFRSMDRTLREGDD